MLSQCAVEVHRGPGHTEEGDFLGTGSQGIQRRRQERTLQRVPRCQRGLQ